MLRGGRSKELGRYCKALATDSPCCCQVSPRRTAQVQLVLLSGAVQSMVPHQRLIMRSEILSAARCIISKLADLGSTRVAKGSTPENMDALEIPVARSQPMYCALLGAVTRYLRFALY